MLKILKQISSFTLAFVVLISTLSFSISKHYCSNILIDTAIVKPAETCSMHVSNDDSKGHHNQNDSCCDEEIKVVEGQDELKVSTQDFSLEAPLEITVFSLIYTFPQNYSCKAPTGFSIYQPPEYSCDFQILHQVFLI